VPTDDRIVHPITPCISIPVLCWFPFPSCPFACALLGKQTVPHGETPQQPTSSDSPARKVPLPVSPSPIAPSTHVQNNVPAKSTHRSTGPLRTHEHAPISRISEDQRSPLVRSVVRPPQFRTPRLCQVLRYDRSPLRNHPLTHPGVFKKPLDFSSSPGNIVSVYACITPNQSLPFQTREIITPQVSQKYPKTSRNNANNAN